MKKDIVIQKLRQVAPDLLQQALFDAIFVPPMEALPEREVLKRPELARYIEAFGRQGDICFAAQKNEAWIGAVWVRLFDETAPGYGFIAESVPELAISLQASYRGCGVGTRLMEAMLLELEQLGYAAVSLSVDERNGAYELYRRIGFYTLRKDGFDHTMLYEFK